jgi:uncharacterized membrane protein
MAAAASPPRKLPLVPIAAGVFVVLAIVGGLVYLNRPAPPSRQNEPASQEAKAYVPNLRLSDVTMQATENLVKQQVVEVQGKISNDGPRALKSVDIYCLFYGIDGREVHRERMPILQAKGRPLQPRETRDFRLPFDTLPDGWNQAVPRMVIAQITFAQ